MFLNRILRFSTLKNTVNVGKRFLNTQQHNVVATTIPFTNSWIYRQNDEIKPPTGHRTIFELPNGLAWAPPLVDPDNDKEIISPPTENNTPKEAVRMIVVRRKKMKKHKLKKLRKKLKFERAKLRQRREYKKEKLFQDKLIQQCKVAEAFSAEDYVQNKLDELHKQILPKFWKGKKLPEFLIRQKMGLPPK